MPVAESATAKPAIEPPIRLRTGAVLRLLGCSRTTLWDWEKRCPKLFAPVARSQRGNIYRLQQVKIMAEVMDGLMSEKDGIELWERTKTENTNDIYRDAGDKSRGARK